MSATQTQIPGTERPAIDEIEEAAEKLRVVRKKRMDLTEDETQLAAALDEAMKKHSVTLYRYAGPEGEDFEAVAVESQRKVKAPTTAASDDETEH